MDSNTQLDGNLGVLRCFVGEQTFWSRKFIHWIHPYRFSSRSRSRKDLTHLVDSHDLRGFFHHPTRKININHLSQPFRFKFSQKNGKKQLPPRFFLLYKWGP